MKCKHINCMLLFAALFAAPGVLDGAGRSDVHIWTRQSLPKVLVAQTSLLSTSLFRSQEENEADKEPRKLCGIECQSVQPSLDLLEQESLLGYETLYENGTHRHTDVRLQWMNRSLGRTPASLPSHKRSKRQVYGEDGRFVITDSDFITNYPFSSAVRLSSGCSGVLVSTKHVLTAAHCVHDGRNYLESARRLRVGLLQLRGENTKLARKKGRKRKGDRKKEHRTNRRNGMKKGSFERARRKRGDERRRRKLRKGAKEEVGERKLSLRRAGGKRSSFPRRQRSVGDGKEPVFRWARVKQTQIPQGWILTNASTNYLSLDYDYALLELKRPVHQKYMVLGVAPPASPLSRIHFSGFDTDKSLLDGGEDKKVIYRFCSVVKESEDLMYQHCDAQRGATGAGIYIRLRQSAGHKDGRAGWQRRVIGVFSGHRWVEEEGGAQRDFNVAVRITPPKYAQICHWIHGDSSVCNQV